MPITLDADAVRAAIADADRPICDEITFVCRARAAAGGPLAAEWEQLRAITSLFPSCDLEQDPEPLLGVEQVSSITDEQLAEWAALADSVANADLVARCSDLYWLRRQHQKRTGEDVARARTAIDAYVTSASQLAISENDIPCFTRFQRALRLARTIGDRPRRGTAKTTLLGIVEKAAANADGVGVLRLLRLLRTEDVEAPDKCAAWCETAAKVNAKTAAATGDYRAYDAAAEYRKERMWWLQKAGQQRDDEEWIKIAQYYADAAAIFEVAAQGSSTPFTSTAVHWQEKSVEALRAGKAAQPQIDAAHRKLLELQKRSVRDLKLIEKKLDVTAMTHAAIEAVENKEYPAALVGFLTCVQVPGADRIRNLVQRRPLMEQLLASVRVNQEGKPVATREGSMDSDDGLWNAMVQKAAEYHVLLVDGAIMPARGVFNSMFPLRLEDVARIVSSSPVMARERERAWARGLHAGFTGDWMLAAHLLPPQIEQSVRALFEATGVITSGLHRSRQHEHDLNRLLAMPEADTVLGESLRLDLTASLANGFGANVRNHMAHGLYDDAHYQSAEVVYMWWQALRLVVLPHFMLPQPAEGDAAAASQP